MGAENERLMVSAEIDPVAVAAIAARCEEAYRRIGTELLGQSSSSCSAFDLGQTLAFEKVFCHNDALSFNIMIPFDFFESVEEKKIVLIDYEYAGYNSRAFDIANHFCGNDSFFIYLFTYLLICC